MIRDAALIDYLASPWAVEHRILTHMAEILHRHARGERLPAEEIDAITDRRDRRPAAGRPTGRPADDDGYRVVGGTAIIPISGVIAKYSRLVNGTSQPRGTSVEAVGADIARALGDREVRDIILRIESPGGSVAGLADLADEIWQASQAKPVTAYVEDLGASAAYWIASQAGRIYANQSALVGSIGVYTVLVDSSAAAEAEGLAFHILRSGEHKGIGEIGVPISADNLATIQAEVDAYARLFKTNVLRGRAERGLTAEDLDELADGRVFLAPEARSAKLIDGIRTFSQALAAARPKLRPAAASETAAPQAKAPSRSSSRLGDLADIHERTSEMDPTTSTPQTTGDANKAPQTQTKTAESPAVTPPPAPAPQRDPAAEERARIAAIDKALGPVAGLADVRAKAVADGLTVEQAKAAAFDAVLTLHAKATADLQGQLAGLQKRLDAIAAGGTDVKAPAAAEESAAGGALSDDGQPETWDRAVAAGMARGLSKPAAQSQAARQFPRSHKAWVQATQPKAGRRAGDN